MRKIFYAVFVIALSQNSIAANPKNGPVINADAKYINRTAYIQAPYISLTSFGNTQIVAESQIAKQNFLEKWFADGTWNVFGGSAVQYTGIGNTGYPNYAYGGDIFAQTGQVGGFSFGGLFTIVNPYFDTQLNGSNVLLAPFLPANKQVNTSEAFLEYQYQNMVQVDAGLIGINNSPWLSQNFYNNALSPGSTYQGAMLNLYLAGGWLLTALAFNAAQAVSETGFTSLTFYNKGYDYAGGLIADNTTGGDSKGTVAVGANYYALDNKYNLRMWGYEFENYGDLLYADNSIKFTPTQDLSFKLASQIGTNNSYASFGNPNGTNALTDVNLGQISSNFIGFEGGIGYKWFNLNLAYNSVWGPQTAYGAGAIVSPYTYGFATDPLYTTPYTAGLVDMGTAGSAFKINPSLSFLDGNLIIAPAATYFSTSSPQWQNSSEYDFITTYTIPQIKGLTLFAVYSTQFLPVSAINPQGRNYVTQLFVTFLY